MSSPSPSRSARAPPQSIIVEGLEESPTLAAAPSPGRSGTKLVHPLQSAISRRTTRSISMAAVDEKAVVSNNRTVMFEALNDDKGEEEEDRDDDDDEEEEDDDEEPPKKRSRPSSAAKNGNDNVVVDALEPPKKKKASPSEPTVVVEAPTSLAPTTTLVNMEEEFTNGVRQVLREELKVFTEQLVELITNIVRQVMREELAPVLEQATAHYEALQRMDIVFQVVQMFLQGIGQHRM